MSPFTDQQAAQLDEWFGPNLTQDTPSSFTVKAARLHQLAAYLIRAHQFDLEPGRSDLEYGRLVNHGALIVLYCSGSVLAQGSDKAAALVVLAPLATKGGR